MEIREVRKARILLPSGDEEALTSWPFGTPLEEEKITNTEFRGVDLSSHRWELVTVSRCRFTDCRMTGLAVEGAAFSDVLFEGCQLDYATLNHLKFTGSAAFVECRFTETLISHSNLGQVVFADCAFRNTEFESSTMADTDLRGNEISEISGLLSLKGAQVTESQLPALFDALANELQLKVSELDR